MKIGKYQVVCFLLVVGFMLLVCSNQTKMYSRSVAQKKQEEKNRKTTVVSKKNVVIQKRTYRYIEYEIIRSDTIQLKYIVPKEDLLVIPSKIDGYKVEQLGKDTESDANNKYVALTKGKKIKKIIIGKGIKTINQSAFFQMKVDEVVLPKTLKNIEAFAFCGSTLKTINLDSIEKIGYGAFQGCKNLKKIRLQKEKVVVEAGAFSACSHLENVLFPKTIKGRFEGSCFEKTGIKKIKWPRFVDHPEKRFGDHMFVDCSKLKSVEFPKNQKHIYIGANMFIGCRRLQKLVFPRETGMVTYRSTPCAGNYTNNVTVLEFRDANTKVRGNKYRDKKGKWKYNFITVNKIVAPKNSKAARYAKKAVCIKEFTKSWLKELKRDSGLSDNYTREDAKSSSYKLQIFKEGKVNLLIAP